MVATDPGVRTALVGVQRELLATGDWVAEGRDIGTVVAPDANLKVFLTASADVRVGRRGEAVDVRDAADTTRADSPAARRTGRSHAIDTTGLRSSRSSTRIVVLAAATGCGALSRGVRRPRRVP